MKRIYGLIAALLVAGLLFGAPVFALDDPLGDAGITKGFEDFADEIANALPFNTMIGLQWSDAHIGQLMRVPPKFGIGTAVGFTTIPLSALESATNAFAFDDADGVDLSDELGMLGAIGLPLPGYVIDARIGGFLLPFDVGVKAGILPEVSAGDFDLDYLLIGGDVRYRVIRGRMGLPTVSVGAGVNYMRGGIGIPGVFGDNIELESVELPDYDDPQQTRTYDLSLSDPSLDFSWSTTVFDLKAQASSNFFILTPYIGAGLSYARSTAGGGLSSSMVVSEGGDTLNDDQIADLQKAYDEARKQNSDLPAIDFSGDSGILVERGVSGWGARVYGGTSVNFFVVKLDLGAMYNLTSNSFGANIGLRFQL
ncbi:hypothetical protein [Spirochaeta africana]|uniref:Outer membrane protein beta-barrel domain-containing protein n=1 Tax=Spirochaeta africana (strain ATCC 700263 / DSM 8902 / Z-7692) TaxID=889378 RepID=H9UMN0_SPIAZ|nr:hypothetical protein [Spirochaeta africana]AFG38773.1 hypothetical protein Spiaf_2749 [Spirochaeta africana DSM 8902]